MDKQVKLMICSEEGEWDAEALEKLRQRGAQTVFEERDGARLVQRIRQERPNVVLMDLFNPGEALVSDRLLVHNPYAGAGAPVRRRGLFCADALRQSRAH